jgi:hypothetical protein
MTNPTLSIQRRLQLESAAAILRLFSITHEILQRSLIPAGFSPSQAHLIRTDLHHVALDVRTRLIEIDEELTPPDSISPPDKDYAS